MSITSSCNLKNEKGRQGYLGILHGIVVSPQNFNVHNESLKLFLQLVYEGITS